MSRYGRDADELERDIWRDLLVAETVEGAEPGDYLRATSRADDGRDVGGGSL